MFFGPVAAVGGLIVNPAGELLLVKRARDPGKGKWGLPGGFVDRGETVEEGLIREVVEETTLQVTSLRLLVTFPNKYDYRGVVSPVIDLFYLCEVDPAAEIKLAPDELESFVWTVPGNEHLDNMAFPSNRRAIEHWLKSTSPS
ncbi:MAG: NUDIX domain-containing protein [Planctomycetota bacterium]